MQLELYSLSLFEQSAVQGKSKLSGLKSTFLLSKMDFKITGLL